MSMSRLLGFGVLVFVLAAGWSIGGRLSADAVGFAVGVVFGVLASLPVAALVLLAVRRRDSRYSFEDLPADALGRQGRVEDGKFVFGQGQTPVVIVTAPPVQMPAAQTQFAGQSTAGFQVIDMPSDRQFRVVGEESEF